MRFIFTRDNLKKLTPSVRPVVADGKVVSLTELVEPKAYIVSDSAPNTPPGLCLYVGMKRKTFYLQVRVGGRVTKVALGDYPRLNVNTTDPLTDVRQIASDVRFSMKRGEDIREIRSEEREVVATTLGHVMMNYLDQYKNGKDPRSNSVKAIEAAIRRLSPWLGKSLRVIGGDSVREIWQRIAIEQGHRTAAEQTLMWCRAAFNVHIEDQLANSNRASFEGGQLANPFKLAHRHIRTRAELEAAYEDRKVRNPLENTPEKLGAWLHALWEKRQRNRDAVDYMLLTLLVGARKSETAKLVWRDQLLAEGLDEALFSVLSLPEGGGVGQVTFRGTKSGATHSVPLGRFATSLMRLRRQKHPNQLYVFPSSSKNPKTESAYYNSPREFVASLRATLEKASMENAWNEHLKKRGAESATSAEAREEFERRYRPQWIFTMHDLRRTFCTVAVNIEGMPYAVVQQLMNHGQMGNVTARYGKPNQDVLRRYMQKLEDEILLHAQLLRKLEEEAGHGD